MNAVEIIGVAVGSAGAVAGVATAIVKRGTHRDALQARTEQTFARLFESEMGKRDRDRGDCTQRIETLTRRIDDQDETMMQAAREISECNARHDRCESARELDRRELDAALERIDRLERKSGAPPQMEPAE